MRKAIFGGLTLLLVASQAMAGDKVWSVPGVINNGLGTVFSCSNGSTASATVTIDIFLKNGAAATLGTNSASIPVNGTTNFVTQTIAGLPGGSDVNLAAGTIVSGSGRITAPSGVYCVAYIADAVNDPPTSMLRLPVIKKTSQKGD